MEEEAQVAHQLTMHRRGAMMKEIREGRYNAFGAVMARALVNGVLMPFKAIGKMAHDFQEWLDADKIAMAKRETRADYLARLCRAALGLRKKFVDKAIGDMHRRCARLYAARGGYFQEGGR